MSNKQRMISAADLEALAGVPDSVKPTAMWLWLNLDPLGRGLAHPGVISRRMYPTLRLDPEEVLMHLLELMEAGFLTTYPADGEEWILLLRPLKCDLRDTRISTPEPPAHVSHGNPVAVGGAGARARERAREQVRAEGAARADAWDAVQRDRERAPERPERPAVLDAPPMFCDEHMPGGAGKTKCGPCRDARNLRDAWLSEKVYEQKLATFYEARPEEAWGDEPF
ncbi:MULTISPECIES: hypothetical protein [unclassified Microbacterium]|uniref:hypothetical protein n=1 Tax=unclassified Microbacterium TaxID=2609290 RepID=UPI0036597C4A